MAFSNTEKLAAVNRELGYRRRVEMLDAGFAAQEKLYEGDYSGEVEFQEARLAAAYRAMRCAAPKARHQSGDGE